MLPPFQVRNLRTAPPSEGPADNTGSSSELQNPHGTVQINAPFYDNLLNDHPEAVLSYMDDDDGQIITVGSSLELSQRLEDPITPQQAPSQRRHSRRHAASRRSSASQSYHMFDIDRSSSALTLWRDIERANRPSTSRWPQDMAKDMLQALDDEDASESQDQEKPQPQSQSQEPDINPTAVRDLLIQREPNYEESSQRARDVPQFVPLPQTVDWSNPSPLNTTFPLYRDMSKKVLDQRYPGPITYPKLFNGFYPNSQNSDTAKHDQLPLPDRVGLTEEGKLQAAAAGARLRSALTPGKYNMPPNTSTVESENRWASYESVPANQYANAPSSLYGAFQDQIQKVQAVSALHAEAANNPVPEKSDEASTSSSSPEIVTPASAEQAPKTPAEIFTSSIKSVVDGVSVLASDLRSNLPEIQEAIMDGTQDVSHNLENVFRDAVDGFNVHIKRVADAAQEASTMAREAADRTREADTKALESVIEGLVMVAAGFGQMGREAFSPRAAPSDASGNATATAEIAPTRAEEDSISPVEAPSEEIKATEPSKPVEMNTSDVESDRLQPAQETRNDFSTHGPLDEGFATSRHREGPSFRHHRLRRCRPSSPTALNQLDTVGSRTPRRHAGGFPYRGYEYINPSDVEPDRSAWARSPHSMRRRYHARSRSPRVRSSSGRSVSPLLGNQKFGKQGPIHLPNDLPGLPSQLSNYNHEAAQRHSAMLGSKIPETSQTSAPNSKENNAERARDILYQAARPNSMFLEHSQTYLPGAQDAYSVPQPLRHRQSWHPSVRDPFSDPPNNGPRQQRLSRHASLAPMKKRSTRDLYLPTFQYSREASVEDKPKPYLYQSTVERELASDTPSNPFETPEMSENSEIFKPSFDHSNKMDNLDPFGEISRFPTLSQFEGQSRQLPNYSWMRPLVPQKKQTDASTDKTLKPKSQSTKIEKAEVKSGPSASTFLGVQQLPGAWPRLSTDEAPIAQSPVSDDQDIYGIEPGYKPKPLHQANENIERRSPFQPYVQPYVQANRLENNSAVYRYDWDSFLQKYETTPGSFPSEQTQQPSARASSPQKSPTIPPPLAPRIIPPLAPRRSHSERSVRFDDQPPAIINENNGLSTLHAHEDAASIQKVSECAKTLKQMGFGIMDSGKLDMDRLVVYAQAADGDLETALEIIDEERQALDRRSSGP